MAVDELKWVAPLLKFLQDKKKRRPKALSANASRPSQRSLIELFWDIANINNSHLRGHQDIANALRSRPKYRHLSLRTLRRDVATATDFAIYILKEDTPRERWPRDERPSPAMFRRAVIRIVGQKH
jgi:hypothetical protein